MAEVTGIEWTDATFNPWQGCAAVSTACDHCYAEALVKRYGGDFATRRRTSPANWKKPLAWNRKAETARKRMRVFCASLADVFDNQVPAEWRADLWEITRATPWLDWQILTKRPQNIAKMLPSGWGDGQPNVWLGVTVENQTEAARRIPILLQTPAFKHFLSCEPLLGPVNLRAWMTAPDDNRLWQRGAIDWVICGGESGPSSRDMPADWARSLRDQCEASSAAFFMKQMARRAEIPIDLRVKEFPI